MKMLRRILLLFAGELFALDEAGNVLILDGSPHVSISAHCGSQFAHDVPCEFCRFVRWLIQTLLARWLGLGHLWPSLLNHCANAYRHELPIIQALGGKS